MSAIEDFELDQLLDAIEFRWGYDFRAYARASIRRRITNAMQRHHVEHISQLTPRILHDKSFFEDVVREFSVVVTEMFRDPHVWQILREKVLPLLATWPYFKIWHAACASGEEVYSMAIMLEEAGLLKRATIYATDFNDAALHKARAGVYSLKDMQIATQNYFRAGGKGSLSDYYVALEDSVQIRKSLRENIVWANHNLVHDQVFGEMNLILCRNVLIYFSHPLQNRVLDLLTASLSHGGILCIGNKENLTFSSCGECYEPLSHKERVYRRTCTHEHKLHPVVLEKDEPKLEKMSEHLPVGVVAIGCSFGGIKALQKLLPTLPEDFPLPILITQHIATSPHSNLAGVLQLYTKLTVSEAEHGELIRAGHIYLAPADYHLLLNDDWTLSLSGDERDNYARPSVNVMFESIADCCGNSCVGVILTGSNEDGARGMRKIHQQSGYTIVQEPSEAEAATMPNGTLAMIKPDQVLGVEKMGEAMITYATQISRRKAKDYG